MKLHLPKALLAAVVLAVAMTGDMAQALTVTKGEVSSYASFSTAEDSTDTLPSGVTYDASTGVLTGIPSTDVWFKLDYSTLPSKVSTSTDGVGDGYKHVIFVTNTPSASDKPTCYWGINTNNSGALSGYWQTSSNTNDKADNYTWTNKDTEANTTVDDSTSLQSMATTGTTSVILNANISGSGTYLYDSAGNKVYDGSGLYSSDGSIASLTVNNAYITDILYNVVCKARVANGSGWAQEYTKAIFNTIYDKEVNATIVDGIVITVGGGASDVNQNNLKNGGDIVIGGSGQLFLQTHSGGEISVSNDNIYLGASSQSDGALRLGAYGGAIDLASNITLVEDSKITKERDKGNDHQVTIRGSVRSEGNYTLTLSADSSGGAFDDVTFAGNVDLHGLTLAGNGGSDIVFSNEDETRTVQIGTLTTQGGAHKLSFDEATTIKSLSMAAGSSLTLAGSGSISIINGGTLVGSIENAGSGQITWSGHATIDEITKLESSGNVGYSENGGLDGYISQAEYFLVKGAGDNSSATVGTGDWKLNEAYTISQSADGKSVVAVVDEANPSGSFYVNTTVNYGGENSSTAIVADTTTGITMNGGTLNLNVTLADGVAITTIKEGSVVNIGEGVTLDNGDIAAGEVKSTICGSDKAVYNMGVVAIAKGYRTLDKVNIGEDWYGTITFASGTTLSDSECKFSINDFANGSNSTVEFAGATGYLGSPSNTGDIKANIKFTDDGLTLNNGYSAATTFTGDFSGSGKWTLSKSGVAQTFNLKGNMSGWSGELKQTTGTYTFNYAASSGKNNTIANKFTAAGGTMTVSVNNANAVEMTGDITADGGILQLTKTGGSKLTVNNLVAKSSNIVLTGTSENGIEVTNLSIASGKTVTGAADVTVSTALTVASEKALTLTGTLTLENNVTIDLSGLSINEEQNSYTLATASGGITSGNINITGLNLIGTAFEGYTASISSTPAATDGIAVVSDSNVNTNLVLTLALTQLTATEIIEFTDGVLTLGTQQSAIGAVFADALDVLISESMWADIMSQANGQEFAVRFQDSNQNTFDFDASGTSVLPTVTLNGMATISTPEWANDGTVVGNFVLPVPEPTTATLSLLALAGLAARRRRR